MSFNIPEFFQRLQWLQDQHDLHYHQDIYTLQRADNLTHMVMHMAKYVGKMVATGMARDTLAFTNDPKPSYAATLTDYLIVLMSVGNRLNINLGNGVVGACQLTASWHDCGGFFPNRELAIESIREALVLPADLEDVGIVAQLAPLTIGIGNMAKALEALDHMENYPSREVLTTQATQMFVYTLRLYHFYSVRPFTEDISDRMAQIERTNIHYVRRPKYSEGFIPVEL